MLQDLFVAILPILGVTTPSQHRLKHVDICAARAGFRAGACIV
jgi:hypothetical protein